MDTKVSENTQATVSLSLEKYSELLTAKLTLDVILQTYCQDKSYMLDTIVEILLGDKIAVLTAKNGEKERTVTEND